MVDCNPQLLASVMWDPKDLHQPIEPLILEYQQKFLERLKDSFPMKFSTLQEKFRAFCEEIYPNLRKFYDQKEGPIDELDCILEKRILILGELQNCRTLEVLSHKDVGIFLENYDLSVRRDPSEMSFLIVDGIAQTDNILSDLINKFKVSDKGKKGEIKAIGDLNNSLVLCLTLIQQYLKSLFDKYGALEYYLCRKESTDLLLHEALREKCKKEFKTHYTTITKVMEEYYKSCLEQVEKLKNAALDIASDSNKISYWKNLHDIIKRVEPKVFRDNVINNLDFTPSEIFFSDYHEKLKKETEFIREKIFQLRDDFEYFLLAISEPLGNLFKKYYISKEIDLFDKKLFEEVELITIFEILVFSDLGISDASLWEGPCYKKIEKLAKDFIIPKLDPFAVQYIQSLLKSIERGGEELAKRRNKFDDELKISVDKWTATLAKKRKEVLLPALFSVFIFFSNSLRDHPHQQYRSFYRKLITRVFRNLSDLEEKFTNYQLVTLMECFYYQFNPAANNNEKVVDKTSMMSFQTKLAALAKQKNSIESILVLENVLYLENCVPSADRPSKFYIERITKDASIRSKHIIVAVSGWTSERSKKDKYWSELVEANPLTEIHAVHYESQNEELITATVLKKLAKVTLSAVDRRIWLSFLGPYGKVVSVGLTAYDGYVKYKETIAETWEKAFKEAVKTGTYLAHILQQAEYYKDKTITLVGFSLGTMVVACCLWELERLKCYDKLFDVMVMGGVVNTADFRKSNLKAIARDLINCYSLDDSVLRYILKRADVACEPVGLSEIITHAKNVKSYDVTEFIKGHFDYRPKMKGVLRKVDFNEDINYIFDH